MGGTNSASRACIVGSDATDAQCPNPVCTVTDHHDSGLTCKAPEIQQINYYTKTASAVVNSGVSATIDRNQLGQYLLTYKAHDNSGNWADEIVFSFLFLDPFVPNLTGFTAEAGVGYNQDINGWAHGFAANCGMGVYTEACLNIYNGKNTWGYSYSSKTTVGTITATGEKWNSKTFGPTGSVQPWAANNWSPATNPAAKYASANLESGFCNYKFGESAKWSCSRTADATWAFDATATPVDNYRATASMTVYMKQDTAAWTTAASVDLCMTGERTYVFHWYVDDLASQFGYKSKSNGNTGERGTKGDGTQVFPEYEAGTYAIVYETKDQHFTSKACRQIENVDHTQPIIQILGSDVMTLEATHQGNYIDDGATCSDQVDGVISQNVEVSGDVVNLSKVGEYTITYNCKDSANNAAPPATRRVIVAQTSCPKCTLLGDATVLHEASFPYADAGATCSDVIDGQVTTQCSAGASKSDTFTAVSDCSTIVNIELTGNYNIRYRAQNTVGLWNDGASCRGGANEYYRLVKVQDTLRPVITLKYKDVVVAKGTHDATGVGQASNTPNYEGDTKSDTDATLNYKDPGTAHSLMAEETTSSVNGWVLGAIASAVAGLALLGYSTRCTAVATSVPV